MEGRPSPEAGRKVAVQVCGTAFSIGGDLFLTAGHVVQGIVERTGGCDLGFHRDGQWLGAICTGAEGFADQDVAILRVPTVEGATQTLPWRTSPALTILEPDQTVGYAYGFDAARGTIGARAFFGHVVSERPWPRLPSNPRIYEMSFLKASARGCRASVRT